MPEGPSLTEGNGIATLEGKLRLTGGVYAQSGSNDGALAASTEFESAVTATVCLKINNFSFSGAHIDALSFN